jgi:hypothetical protein
VRRAAVDHTWDQQLEQFARFSLYVFVSLYEGWLATTLSPFPRPAELAKWLQFPSTHAKGREPTGVRPAIAAATQSPSVPMRRAFAAPLRAQRRYALRQIDVLLTCYRYFKECRNSLLHGAGVAHGKLALASQAMQRLTVGDVGTRAMPEHVLFAVGDPVSVTLRGVIGFSEVVNRIVTTIDAELALTLQGEAEFLYRWSSKYRPTMVYPFDVARRRVRIQTQTVNAGFPVPANPAVLERLLRDAGRVRHF